MLHLHWVHTIYFFTIQFYTHRILSLLYSICTLHNFLRNYPVADGKASDEGDLVDERIEKNKSLLSIYQYPSDHTLHSSLTYL